MSSYKIEMSSASSSGLRQLPPYTQRAIENALTAVAREASTAAEQVQFAGGMQLSGAWVAWAVDHDEQIVSLLAVEPDAEMLDNRTVSVAA